MLLPESQRNRPEMLSSLMIARPVRAVPLSQVARIAPTEDRYRIDHDGGQRYVAITFNVAGRGLQATVDDAKARSLRSSCRRAPISSSPAPPRRRPPAAIELLLYTAFALVLIGVILFDLFHWRANSWLVLVNLPFSLIGSVVAIA